MDSRPKPRSQRRRQLREPYNRVYREYPENLSEDRTTEELVEVKVKFYFGTSLNSLRWIYCWGGSPVQHCQVCIDGLIHTIDSHITSHWLCEELYIGDKSGGSYELAKELIFKVPRSLIDWDKIRAVSEGFRINIWKSILWGILRHHGKDGISIPKPSPDCVSVSKQILGTLKIWASGELPWELYECLVKNYQPEEKSYRSFK